MVSVGRDALDRVCAMVGPLLPERGLRVHRALDSRFARGQNNTLERAICVSHVYSAIEPAVRDALYTCDIARGLQDLVGHVRALKLDARSGPRVLRAPEGVGVDVASGGNEEARVVDGEVGLELARPLGRQRSGDEMGVGPVVVGNGVVAARGMVSIEDELGVKKKSKIAALVQGLDQVWVQLRRQ